MAFDVNAEIREMGDSLKSFVTNYKGAFELLLKRVDNIEYERGRQPARHDGGSASLRKMLAEFERRADVLKTNGSVRFDSPSILLEQRAVTTTGLVGSQSFDRIGVADGNVYGGVRALFASQPMTEANVFQVRESTTAGWGASPQVETTTKNESTPTLTGETISARTIASWVSASRQSLSDVHGLAGFLESRLIWSLAKELDEQILFGSGAAEDLHGLALQATAFDTGLLLSSYDFAGCVGAAVAQLAVAGFRANFCIVNPIDAYKLSFRRDSVGQYIQAPATLPPLTVTPVMPAGEFLVGDSQHALVRVRELMTVVFSESHSDYFVKNLVAIRAEERCALQCLSPRAFIHGNLTSSPA